MVGDDCPPQNPQQDPPSNLVIKNYKHVEGIRVMVGLGIEVYFIHEI